LSDSPEVRKAPNIQQQQEEIDPNADSDDGLDPNADSDEELDPNKESDEELDPNADREEGDHNSDRSQKEGESEQEEAKKEEPTVQSMFEKKRQQIESLKQMLIEFQDIANKLFESGEVDEETDFDEFLEIMKYRTK
jgi:hypothetical protein